MEETQNVQEPKKQETAGAPTQDAQDTPAQQEAAQPTGVTLSVTLNGETTETPVQFNTPKLLAQVKGLDDAATVKISDGQHTLLEGSKAQAVEILEKAVMPVDQLAPHLQQLMRNVVYHSTVKATAVSVVCVDDGGNDAGFGFVITSADCTAGEAVALVNCSDANMDEFATKAKLSVPGRNAPEKGGIITPTQEQVQALGK